MKLGGSEVRTLWLVWALRRAGHRVTLATLAPPSLDALNALHHTPLRATDFTWSQLHFPVGVHGLSALKWRWFERECARRARDFDLFISTYNPMNIGVRSIAFVADFSWHAPTSRMLDGEPPGSTIRRAAARGYRWALAGAPVSSWLPQHWLIANSQWTAGVLERATGVRPNRVIYPPVQRWLPADAPRTSSGVARFLWLGRITPEKRVGDAVTILERVRRHGFEAELHVAGEWEDSKEQQQFEREHHGKPWLHLHGRATGQEKAALLARCEFGLHTRPNEPFGVSVAEMMAAGCLVFTPAGGAPGDLLRDTGLTFESPLSADRVIADVLARPNPERAKIAADLRSRAQAFTPDVFCQKVTELVAEFVAAAGAS